MNKKILLGGLIVLIISMLFIKSYNQKNDFKDFISKLNEENKLRVDEFLIKDIHSYIDTNLKFENTFSEKEIYELVGTQGSNLNKELALDEVKDDINTAFKLLKESYGAYEYFGGDKVFLEAKEKIIKEMEDFEMPIKNEDIKRSLINNLDFILDGHFMIGYELLNSNNKIINVFNDDYFFFEENERFYTIIDNDKLYINSIVGFSIEELMKPTITPEGELAYLISTMINRNDGVLELEISLINNRSKEVINEKITMKKNFGVIKMWDKAFEEKEINNIPILQLNSMLPKNSSDKSLDEFIETSKKIKKEKSFIIDLRGNGGGLNTYWLKWLNNYMEKEVLITQKTFLKESRAKNLGLKIISENKGLEESIVNEIVKYTGNEKNIFWDYEESQGKWFENESVIFVLIDNFSGSATEIALSYLENIENVVFVGSNSSGTMLSLYNLKFILPNSKLSFYFGTGIAFTNRNENIDDRGIEPDIWVNSTNALDRVISLIDYYNLN